MKDEPKKGQILATERDKEAFFEENEVLDVIDMTADITFCSNQDCKLRPLCARANPPQVIKPLSFALFLNRDRGENGCDFFIMQPIKNTNL